MNVHVALYKKKKKPLYNSTEKTIMVIFFSSEPPPAVPSLCHELHEQSKIASEIEFETRLKVPFESGRQILRPHSGTAEAGNIPNRIHQKLR